MHRDIAKKIKELDSTLDRITKEKDQFKFSTSAASHSDQESKRVTTTFDVDVSEIQGYVTMESEGRELFGVLAMRSFFQDLEKDDMDSNIIISCKMHDIVHDFAQFLTKNECYSIDQHEDKVGFKNLRHLSWLNTNMNMNLPSICDIGKLRSFFAIDFSPAQLTSNLFNGLKSVRVLGLHGWKLQELPKEIGNLLHLRLPEGIGNLVELRYINLNDCENVEELPKGIGNLINLRHLDIRGTKRLEMMPQADVEEAKKAELRKKKHIKELHLHFSPGVDVGIDVGTANFGT
nr:putative disease resistance protein RGA3 [Ipomoea trifida]